MGKVTTFVKRLQNIYEAREKGRGELICNHLKSVRMVGLGALVKRLDIDSFILFICNSAG